MFHKQKMPMISTVIGIFLKLLLSCAKKVDICVDICYNAFC